MTKKSKSSVSKTQVLAIREAIPALANMQDALRIERCELKLCKSFTESQARNIVKYLREAQGEVLPVVAEPVKA